MAATAEAAGKKALAAGVAAPSSPRAAGPEAVSGKRTPLPGDTVAVVDSESATATTTAVESSGEENEQVEKFYALLANIRAMTDMYRVGDGACGVRKKRARGAEPPWRPAFRMEDFEEVEGASSLKKERRDDGDGAGGRARRRRMGVAMTRKG